MDMLYKSGVGAGGDPTDYIANAGFYIEIYHINSGKTVRFKAFMKDYNDIYNISYDDQFFVGQTEPIKKWKSTVRQIDVSFAAVAFGMPEARQNLAKVSLLTNMLYPEQQFDGNGMITKVGGSPIFKIRFLNLIAGPGHNGMAAWGPAWETGLQGYLANFMYRMDPENGILFHGPSLRNNAKKTRRKERTSEQGQNHHVYPQEMTISFTFYPVYERSPGWHESDNGMVFTINNSPISDSPYVVSTKAGETQADSRIRGAHAAASGLAAAPMQPLMGEWALTGLDEAAADIGGDTLGQISTANAEERSLWHENLALRKQRQAQEDELAASKALLVLAKEVAKESAGKGN